MYSPHGTTLTKKPFDEKYNSTKYPIIDKNGTPQNLVPFSSTTPCAETLFPPGGAPRRGGQKQGPHILERNQRIHTNGRAEEIV